MRVEATPDLRDHTEYSYPMLQVKPPWSGLGLYGASVYWRSCPLPTREEMRAARKHAEMEDGWVLP